LYLRAGFVTKYENKKLLREVKANSRYFPFFNLYTYYRAVIDQDKNSVENYFMYWEMKLIERTVPDKPNSKNQKYRKR